LGNKVVAKYDLCPGLEVPVCVANCSNEAFVFVEEEKENVPEFAGLSIKK
jgi:Fe-S-cluster-containing hydrogenase component 2